MAHVGSEVELKKANLSWLRDQTNPTKERFSPEIHSSDPTKNGRLRSSIFPDSSISTGSVGSISDSPYSRSNNRQLMSLMKRKAKKHVGPLHFGDSLILSTPSQHKNGRSKGYLNAVNAQSQGPILSPQPASVSAILQKWGRDKVKPDWQAASPSIPHVISRHTQQRSTERERGMRDLEPFYEQIDAHAPLHDKLSGIVAQLTSEMQSTNPQVLDPSEMLDFSSDYRKDPLYRLMQEELESVDLALTRMKSRFSDLSTVIGENESMAPLSAKISTPGGRHHAAKLTLYQQLSVVNMKACPKLQPVASNQILSAMIRSRELKQIREFGSLTTEMFVTTRATFALLVAFFEFKVRPTMLLREAPLTEQDLLNIDAELGTVASGREQGVADCPSPFISEVRHVADDKGLWPRSRADSSVDVCQQYGDGAIFSSWSVAEEQDHRSKHQDLLPIVKWGSEKQTSSQQQQQQLRNSTSSKNKHRVRLASIPKSFSEKSAEEYSSLYFCSDDDYIALLKRKAEMATFWAFLGVQLDAVLAGREKQIQERTNRDVVGELRNLVDNYTWAMLKQLLSRPSECAYALHCIEFGTDINGGGGVNHQETLEENKNQFQWFPRSCLPVLRHISESAVFHPSALSRTSAACARLCGWARRVIAKIFAAKLQEIELPKFQRQCPLSSPSLVNRDDGDHEHNYGPGPIRMSNSFGGIVEFDIVGEGAGRTSIESKEICQDGDSVSILKAIAADLEGMTFATPGCLSVQHGSEDIKNFFDTTDLSTPVTQDFDELGQKELQAQKLSTKHDTACESNTTTLEVGDRPKGGQNVEVGRRIVGGDPLVNTEQSSIPGIATDAAERTYTDADDNMPQRSTIQQTVLCTLPIQKPFRLIAAVDGSSSSHDGFVAAMALAGPNDELIVGILNPGAHNDDINVGSRGQANTRDVQIPTPVPATFYSDQIRYYSMLIRQASQSPSHHPIVLDCNRSHLATFHPLSGNCESSEMVIHDATRGLPVENGVAHGILGLTGGLGIAAPGVSSVAVSPESKPKAVSYSGVKAKKGKLFPADLDPIMVGTLAALQYCCGIPHTAGNESRAHDAVHEDSCGSASLKDETVISCNRQGSFLIIARDWFFPHVPISNAQAYTHQRGKDRKNKTSPAYARIYDIIKEAARGRLLSLVVAGQDLLAEESKKSCEADVQGENKYHPWVEFGELAAIRAGVAGDGRVVNVVPGPSLTKTNSTVRGGAPSGSVLAEFVDRSHRFIIFVDDESSFARSRTVIKVIAEIARPIDFIVLIRLQGVEATSSAKYRREDVDYTSFGGFVEELNEFKARYSCHNVSFPIVSIESVNLSSPSLIVRTNLGTQCESSSENEVSLPELVARVINSLVEDFEADFICVGASTEELSQFISRNFDDYSRPEIAKSYSLTLSAMMACKNLSLSQSKSFVFATFGSLEPSA